MRTNATGMLVSLKNEDKFLLCVAEHYREYRFPQRLLLS